MYVEKSTTYPKPSPELEEFGEMVDRACKMLDSLELDRVIIKHMNKLKYYIPIDIKLPSGELYYAELIYVEDEDIGSLISFEFPYVDIHPYTFIKPQGLKDHLKKCNYEINLN